MDFMESMPLYAGVYADNGITEEQVEELEEKYDEVFLEKGVLILIDSNPIYFEYIKNTRYLTTSVIFDPFDVEEEVEEIIERYADEEPKSIIDWWEAIKGDRELCMIL